MTAEAQQGPFALCMRLEPDYQARSTSFEPHDIKCRVAECSLRACLEVTRRFARNEQGIEEPIDTPRERVVEMSGPCKREEAWLAGIIDEHEL